MVIDAFLCAGEIEMLKFRMKILDPVVDQFIAVQGITTHQGELRALSFTKHEKLINHATDSGDGSTIERENRQREGVLEATFSFDHEDMIILGDVDEIPSREAVEEMRENPFSRCCVLDFFYYRLRHLRPERCSITCTNLGLVRETGVEMLRRKRGSFPFTKSNGWHLSYFGGTEAIKKKLRSFCHAEFNQPEFLDDEWLEQCQENGHGLLKCGTICAKTDPSFFPQYFLDAAPKEWF